MQNSQQSSAGSDDHLLEKVLAERLAVAREKKRQERDKKFLDGASTKLNEALSQCAGEVRSAAESMEEIYSKFLLEYAASEDRIYHLWSAILKEHQHMEALIQNKIVAGTGSTKQCETRHISGLSKVKGACNDFESIMQQFLEDPKEVSDPE
ncbi:hypothetical protein FA15DRAFT_613700 [Coprinopsis marcescibilis]|uniref:Uncharacterized protein n=1 Tax=Coprinopsis marcescibilis TaxID=230819 RepID=A0A5C3L3I9_COPMA|nr:hypothetical protein FA15DRAFT_613700 [Coprinopsis marcescibilis]